jgi:hypothetical protein
VKNHDRSFSNSLFDVFGRTVRKLRLIPGDPIGESFVLPIEKFIILFHPLKNFQPLGTLFRFFSINALIPWAETVRLFAEESCNQHGNNALFEITHGGAA